MNFLINQELFDLYHSVHRPRNLKCVRIESIKCPHRVYKSKINVWHNDPLTDQHHGYRTFYLCETCHQMYKRPH